MKFQYLLVGGGVDVRRPDFSVYVPKVSTFAERQAWRKAVL